MSTVCPQCNEKMKRSQRICRQCKRIMVFHKTSDMNDQKWLDLIDDVSAQGRYYFTLNQLYIQWQKPKAYRIHKALIRMYISIFILTAFSIDRSLSTLISAVVLMGISMIPVINDYVAYPVRNPRIHKLLNIALIVSSVMVYQNIQWHIYLVLPLLLLGFALVEFSFLSARIGKKRFMLHLSMWKRVYRMKRLLLKPQLQKPLPELQKEALYDYQVRNILIVDQDLTVDFFVKNGFHQQLNTLIFSLQKYPHYMSQLAFRLIVNHDDIKIFLLYKESKELHEVRKTLRNLGAKKHRVIVLGLHKSSKYSLIRHLGFKPFNWPEWHVDTLPPHSLFEGVLCATQSETSIKSCLHPKQQVHLP